MVLEQYKDVLGNLAASIGIFHLIIPGMICLQIIRKGNTENVSPGHFMIGGCITLMQMRHGQLLNSSHMVSSTKIGFTMCMLYLSVYIVYCDNRKSVFQLLAKMFAIPALVIGYTYLDEVSRATEIYGTICSVMMFCLMSFPLYQTRKAFQEKHTGDMSLLMALFGSLDTGLWFLYSLTLGNYIEILSRLVTFLMISVQIIPFCIYPMPKSSSSPEKAKAH